MGNSKASPNKVALPVVDPAIAPLMVLIGVILLGVGILVATKEMGFAAVGITGLGVLFVVGCVCGMGWRHALAVIAAAVGVLVQAAAVLMLATAALAVLVDPILTP